MRLFVAIELPPEVKEALAACAERLERQADAARMVPRDNFHITLAFIGQTKRVDEACAVFERTARMEFLEPLELVLEGIGTFKSHGRSGGSKGSRKGSEKGGGTHAWWVGVESPPALAQLANAFVESYHAEGFDVERRTFKPHITLARGVRTSKPLELVLPRLAVTANRLSLMKSDLSGPHPVYTSLRTCFPGVQ
jgi:2'-5' RNA ligase